MNYVLLLLLFSQSLFPMNSKDVEPVDKTTAARAWQKEQMEIEAADAAGKKKIHEKLKESNKQFLFGLTQHVDHPCIANSMRSSAAAMQTIKANAATTVFTVPSAVNHVALNADGSSLAIAHANDLTIINTKKYGVQSFTLPTFRYALSRIAFKDDKTLIATHPSAVCRFDAQGINTPFVGSINHQSYASFVSRNGHWILMESQTHGHHTLSLENIQTSLLTRFTDTEIKNITQFAASKVGTFLIARGKCMGLYQLRVTQNGADLKSEASWDSENAAIDISEDGACGLSVYNDSVQIYSLNNIKGTTVPYREFTVANKRINACCFHPRDNAIIILAGDFGVRFYNSVENTHSHISVAHDTVSSVAMSNDGKTLAVGTENGVYVLDIRDAQKMLTVEQQLLIHYLSTTDAEQLPAIIAAPQFKTVFESITAARIKQTMVKCWPAIAAALSYEECPVCKDAYGDVKTECAHRFCFDCYEKCSEEHLSCPLCRKQLAAQP